MDAAKWAAKWAMGGVLAGAGAAAYAQHAHYLRTRREVLGDQAPTLHSGSVRYCVVLLRTKGGDMADAVRRLRYAAEAGGAALVYAGKARQTVIVSEQLPKEWSGFVLLQFRSHDHASRVRGSAAYAAALAACAASYHHVEFARVPGTGLIVPLALLLVRLRQALRGERVLPFTEASPQQLKDGILGKNAWTAGRLTKIDDIDYRDQTVLDDEPAVQLNICRGGSAADRKKNQAYGMNMMNVFAAARTCPIYVARATWWDGKDEGVHWDEVAIAHYPSRRFFMEMVTSTYYNGIVGDKQLGDTLCLAGTPCKL